MITSRQIEAHKENLASSNEGRSVPSLKRALDASEIAGRDVNEMKLKLRKCERGFFNDLEGLLDCEDPLQHFVDYLGRLDAICPSGSSTQQKRALECCARKFLSSKKYHDDLRYVKVWVRYANLSSDPTSVFKYMAQASIGTKTAKYYLSYARHLVNLRFVRQAEAVFQRALEVGAKPADTIQHGLKMLRLASLPHNGSGMVPLPNLTALESAQRPHQIKVYKDETEAANDVDNVNDVFPSSRAPPGEMPSLTYAQQENPVKNENEDEQLVLPQLGPPKHKIEVYRSPLKSRRIEIIKPTNDQKEMYVAMDFLYQQKSGGGIEEYSIDEIMLQTRRLNNLKFPRRLPPDGNMHTSPISTSQHIENTKTMMDARNLLLNARANPSKPDYTDYNPLTMNLRAESLQNVPTVSAPPKGPLENQPPVLQPHRPATPELRLQNVEFERLEEIFPSEPPSTPGIQFPEVVDPAASNLRELLNPVLLSSLQLDVNFVHNSWAFKTLRKLKAATTSTDLVLNNVKFKLRKKIASGGYGTVWPCVNEKTGHIYALKGEKTRVPWEVYSLKMARSRIKSPRVLDSISRLYYSESFTDEQYHLMPLFKYNTLLSVATALRARPKPERVVEKLAVFVAIELLRVVEHLHQNDIIHGDLKAENVMMRAPDIVRTCLPSKNYSSDGSYNWDKYGIVLIDFGRSVDLKLFPPNQKFRAGWTALSTDSYEIRNNLPWTYEIDYHGVAEVVHVLLFQDRMDGLDPSQERRKIRRPLKRTWNTSLWNEFFDCLLNTHNEQLPICGRLFTLRAKFEQFLNQDSEGLQPLLVEMLGELRRRHK